MENFTHRLFFQKLSLSFLSINTRKFYWNFQQYTDVWFFYILLNFKPLFYPTCSLIFVLFVFVLILFFLQNFKFQAFKKNSICLGQRDRNRKICLIWEDYLFSTIFQYFSILALIFSSVLLKHWKRRTECLGYVMINERWTIIFSLE